MNVLRINIIKQRHTISERKKKPACFLLYSEFRLTVHADTVCHVEKNKKRPKYKGIKNS